MITTAAVDAARYENGELLLEEARTNFIDRNISNYSSIWGNVVPSGAYNNAGIAPDGTNTAFATTAYAPEARGQKNYTLTADTNDYTFSIFIKSTGGQGQYVAYRTGCNNVDQDTPGQVVYDFSTDTVGGGYSRKIYANGWVRIWRTYTNNNSITFLTSNSDTTSLDMLFWGAQVEIGSYPSSLIITPDGANVTRAADVSTSALGVDSWYNQSEGTVFYEASAKSGGIPAALFNSGSFDSLDPRINVNVISGSLGGGGRTQVNVSGIQFDTGNNSTPSYSLGTIIKQASAFQADNFAHCFQGGTVITDNSGTMPSTLSRASIGYSWVPKYINGHISRLAYFPTRKTDQELIDLTT